MARVSRVKKVMEILEVEENDAEKIVKHLKKHDRLHWIDDYDEEYCRDEPLVDVHYEDSFEDMIDWQYEDYSPSQMLGMSTNIADYKEMCELTNKVIFWYGLV